LINISAELFQVPQQENLQMLECDAEVDLVQTSDKVNKSDILTETKVKAPEKVNDIKQPTTSCLLQLHALRRKGNYCARYQILYVN
jgi:hypothetical protein